MRVPGPYRSNVVRAVAEMGIRRIMKVRRLSIIAILMIAILMIAIIGASLFVHWKL